jgi:hypothetical protein
MTHELTRELTVRNLVVAGVITYLIILALPFTFRVLASLHRGAWTGVPVLALAWLSGH